MESIDDGMWKDIFSADLCDVFVEDNENVSLRKKSDQEIIGATEKMLRILMRSSDFDNKGWQILIDIKSGRPLVE